MTAAGVPYLDCEDSEESAPLGMLEPVRTARDHVAFILFLVVNAVTFLRPGELAPILEGLPFYEYSILMCLVAALPSVADELHPRRLLQRPITLAVLGLMVVATLSHLVRGSLYEARFSGFIFLKLSIYFVLLVALVDSYLRLRRLLLCLLVFVTIIAAVGVLQYHQVLNLPALSMYQDKEEDPNTGEMVLIPRLCSIGVFHDPNDLGMMMAAAAMLALWWLTDRQAGTWRWLALPVLLMLGYAFSLTLSRGAMLALLGGVGLLMYHLWGWRRTALALAPVVMLLLAVFAGRATDISLTRQDDTAQDRVQIWSDALAMVKGSPVLGIGQGMFVEEVGFVTHNTYLHMFAEMGLLGGGLFLGAWYVAWRLLRGGDRRLLPEQDAALGRMQPYLMGMVGAYGVGMLSLSRGDIVPTYLMLGVPVIYARLTWPDIDPAPRPLRVSGSLVVRVLGLSVLFLAAVYVFVRLFKFVK